MGQPGARQAHDGLRGRVWRQVHDRGDGGEHQRRKAQGGAGFEGGCALISPIAESELGDVMRFLRTVFGVSESHRMFQADVLRWKCFAPHPFWEGDRGYALRYKGEIAAFGCLVPCRFLTGSGTVASCDVIDWAASKAVPGAGIMLYRHIQGLTGTMINIVRTGDASQVLPKIGFQVRAERHSYTRVLRPWHHFRQTHQRDWKSPLRLARDYRRDRRRQPSAAEDRLSGAGRETQLHARES